MVSGVEKSLIGQHIILPQYFFVVSVIHHLLYARFTVLHSNALFVVLMFHDAISVRIFIWNKELFHCCFYCFFFCCIPFLSFSVCFFSPHCVVLFIIFAFWLCRALRYVWNSDLAVILDVSKTGLSCHKSKLQQTCCPLSTMLPHCQTNANLSPHRNISHWVQVMW